jgi:hypothetical protein
LTRALVAPLLSAEQALFVEENLEKVLGLVGKRASMRLGERAGSPGVLRHRSGDPRAQRSAGCH